MLIRIPDERVHFCPRLGGCTADEITSLLTGELPDGILPNGIRPLLDRWYRNVAHVYDGNDQECDWTGFNDPDHPNHLEIKSIPRDASAHWGMFDSLWDRVTDIGHDLPVWFTAGDGEPRHRVMIVSQDPLRDELPNGALHLSSPFGTHCETYSTPAARLVENVVKRLLRKNVAVYLTDFSKLYFTFDHRRTSWNERLNFLSARVDWEEACRRILDREIALFGPTLVVLMGREVVVSTLERFDTTGSRVSNVRFWTRRGGELRLVRNPVRRHPICEVERDFYPTWHLTGAHLPLSHEQKVACFVEGIMQALR